MAGIEYKELITVLISIFCGSILGIEREYNNKSAGFRTIILICLGSTIFTLISQKMGGSDDRIAANIITGIGFIGAGVIFKDNFSVMGLTTATVIWLSAAIGMMIGIEKFNLGILLSIIGVIILSLFSGIESLLDRFNHRKTFTLIFINTDLKNLYGIEKLLKANRLKYRKRQVSKRDDKLIVVLDVLGNKRRINLMNEKLIKMQEIIQM
ncbi:MAG: MgtC/SapB family protein [Daejeonella sp.]